MDPLKELDPRPNKVIDVEDLPSMTNIPKQDIVTKKFLDNYIRLKQINGSWYVKLSDIEYTLFGKIDNFDEYASKAIELQYKIGPSNFVYDEGSTDPWVNEQGFYEALLKSDLPEANKFKSWTTKVLTKLRSIIGLGSDNFIKMLDKNIQDDIDFILDSLYWDDKNKCVMQSIIVPGGDVKQIVFSR